MAFDWDASTTKLDRSIKAFILAMFAPGLGKAAILFAPVAPAVSVLLMAAGIGCLIVATGLLISCAFVGKPQTSPLSWGVVATGASARNAPGVVEPEACHCMNCLNKREW